MIDPPRDPVVYLLWRAWRALAAPPRPTAVRISRESAPLLHLAMHVDTYRTVRARATADPDPGETDRREVPTPEPIGWTVSDPDIIQIDQAEGVATTIYARAPGTATLTVKAGDLRDTASITVAHRPATRVDIVEWVDPLMAP